jgi:drug/metabolite transporter (DMT)-like permease
MALSPYLWVAIISYISVMMLFMAGLRLWENLSALYPVYGSTFVWATVLAVIWLGESVSLRTVIGTALVIAGIACVSREPPDAAEHSV